MALVVEVVSAWLVDGVVDPTAHAWFPSCRAAYTGPVVERLARAETRMRTAVNLALDRLQQELIDLISPVAVVERAGDRWQCVWTDLGDDLVDDELIACIRNVACMVAMMQSTREVDRELFVKLLLVKVLFAIYRQLLPAPAPLPGSTTAWFVLAVTELFAQLHSNRAKYYDPQWRPPEELE